ncbi:MAG: hypothetical protein QXE81_04315 [Desulfurococcaceae archaeon]
MSHARSSALKWFEYLLEDAKKKMMRIRRRDSASRMLERLVNLGDMVFPRLVYLSEKLAYIINKFQITMIESMILASLWSGALLLLLIIIITVLIR